MTSIQEASSLVLLDEIPDWLTDLRMDVLVPWFFHTNLRDFFGYGGVNRWRVLERDRQMKAERFVTYWLFWLWL